MQTDSAIHDDDLVMGLVEGALGRPSAEREPWLRAACKGDEALFDEVVDLVVWEEKMGRFLREPIVPRPPSTEDLFASGSILNERFRIARECGRGSRSIVYEAVDLRQDQRVAIRRVWNFEKREDPPEFSHPGVCGTLGAHTAESAEGPVEFTAMEYCGGTTLADRLRKRALSDADAASVADSLAPVLRELRIQGIGTGGISARKIMVERDQRRVLRAKLLDPIGLRLGLAGNFHLPDPIRKLVERRLTQTPWLRGAAPIAVVAMLAAAGILLPSKPLPKPNPIRLAVLVGESGDGGWKSEIQLVEDRIRLGTGDVMVIPASELRRHGVSTLGKAYSVLAATSVLTARRNGDALSVTLYDAKSGAPIAERQSATRDSRTAVCSIILASLGQNVCPDEPPDGQPSVAREVALARRADADGAPTIALAHLARAVHLAPRNADLWRDLAKMHEASGNVRAAIDSWLGAVAAQPDYYPGYMELGNYYVTQGRFSEAEQMFRHISGVAPEFADALKGLGLALGRLGRVEESMQVFRKAAEVSTSAN